MAQAQSVMLRSTMSFTETLQEISKLGNTKAVPITEIGLDINGDKVLFLRNPTAADKLKGLFLSKSKQDANVDRLLLWVENACEKAGIDPNCDAMTDVKRALINGEGGFQYKLHLLEANALLQASD